VWSTNNAWQARVDRAQELEQERLNAEYEAERLEWRRKRRVALGDNFATVLVALQGADTEDLPVDRVTRALTMVAQELRKEYDDDPATRVEVSIRELDTAIERELARVAPSSEDATVGTAGGDADAGTE
jgi:hypothetical protein